MTDPLATPQPPAGDDSTPRVLVVLPAYNEAANVPACLAGIRAQDYPADRVGVVLVDNGSADDTAAVARRGGAQVLVAPEATIAGLRNAGAAAGEGEILAFLDADMVPRPAWLRTAVAALADPAVGAVGGALDIPDDATWVERTWCLPRRALPERRTTPWLPSGNFVMRREVFDEVGGFDATLTTCEDVDLSARIRGAGRRLLFVKRAAVVHRGESKTLGALFRKEVWRGRSSLDRLGQVWRDPREVQSALLPAVQLVFMAAVLAAAALGRWSWAGGAVLATALLPALRAVRVAWLLRTIRHLPRQFVVWYVYYAARAVAVLRR
jgi:glycosyltransferase involved in cell wall biosynthesis